MKLSHFQNNLKGILISLKMINILLLYEKYVDLVNTDSLHIFCSQTIYLYLV